MNELQVLVKKKNKKQNNKKKPTKDCFIESKRLQLPLTQAGATEACGQHTCHRAVQSWC